MMMMLVFFANTHHLAHCRLFVVRWSARSLFWMLSFKWWRAVDVSNMRARTLTLAVCGGGGGGCCRWSSESTLCLCFVWSRDKRTPKWIKSHTRWIKLTPPTTTRSKNPKIKNKRKEKKKLHTESGVKVLSYRTNRGNFNLFRFCSCFFFSSYLAFAPHHLRTKKLFLSFLALYFISSFFFICGFLRWPLDCR